MVTSRQQHDANRASLPYQAARYFPATAYLSARGARYGWERGAVLRELAAARAIIRSSDASDYAKGRAHASVDLNRPYLANLRAARGLRREA